MSHAPTRATLYCLSLGPGDPELVSLKSLRLLKACPILAAPRTSSGSSRALAIAEQLIDLSSKELLPLDFAMSPSIDERRAGHLREAKRLMDVLDRGRDVALLCLGDASIYATSTYLLALLRKEGYPCEVVAGVTSYSAAAAALGISLADYMESVHILPGNTVDIRSALELPGTKIFMKTAQQIHELQAALKGSRQQAYAVIDCGLPSQRLCYGLDELTAENYFTLVIVKDQA